MNIIRKFWLYLAFSWNQKTTYTSWLEIKYKYLLKYFWKIINIYIQILYTTTNTFDNNEEKDKKKESRDNFV